MESPYVVLSVDESASDEEIAKAYLAQVKCFPPEREPERFQALREAFEQIKDKEARLKFKLFNSEFPDYASLAAPILASKRQGRPTREVLLKALAASVFRKSPDS